MLRMSPFDVVAPRSIKEAVTVLQRGRARIVSGGTDLLPNLKHRLETPETLVSLANIRELGVVEIDEARGSARIGAGVRLVDIATHAGLARHFPSLVEAAGGVASPQIRNMGTIGGNIHLDTRCRYVNQSEFWRSAIGGCLKSEGSVCHVVPGGKNCVAALSSDCVPVLTVLEGVVHLVGENGTRTVAIADYYNSDGTAHINKAPNEIMTFVEVPLPSGPRRCGYHKWTVRKSIDFPLISVALRFDLAGREISHALVCVGVLSAKPRLIKGLERVRGYELSHPEVASVVSDAVYRQAKPLENVPYEAAYRHKMLRVHTARAVARLAGL